MHTTNDWCTYTLDRNEAYKYRFEDRSPNRWAKVSGQVYVKYVKLFHFDKKERKYWLPPVTWWNRKAMMGFWQEIHVDPIMKLWEWQQKTIDYCSRSFSQWVSSILVVSETATGKSIQMLGLVAKFKCKTLIVVPSEAIGVWLEDKLSPYCDAKYLNWDKIRKAFDKLQMPDVLITHRQSAVNCWDMINWSYDLMLNDEQHHLSDWMKMMCNTWKWRWIIWLTWTPFRKEMTKEDFLLYFQKIYDTGLKSLPVRVLTHKYRHRYTMDDFMKASEGLEPESPEVLRRLVNANDDKIFDLKNVVSTLYHKCWFKKIMVFVDRREYQEHIKELVFPNAVLINWDTDKEKVLEELKTKDQFLIIWMVSASWEWFDVPGIECWILFFSTAWMGSIEQMVGRAKRFSEWKEYAYRVDIQESSTIEPDQHKWFGQWERMKFYAERWWPVMKLEDYVKGLSDNTRLFKI